MGTIYHKGGELKDTGLWTFDRRFEEEGMGGPDSLVVGDNEDNTI